MAADKAGFRRELVALHKQMIAESDRNVTEAVNALKTKQTALLERYNAASVQLARQKGIEPLKQFALGAKSMAISILKWSV